MNSPRPSLANAANAAPPPRQEHGGAATYPIGPVGPTSTAGLEAGLQPAPQYRPRVAVRALSPSLPTAYSQTAHEVGLRRGLGPSNLTRGRADPNNGVLS